LDHRVGGPHIYVKLLSQYLSDKVTSSVVTTSHGNVTDIALINLRHIWSPLYLVEVLLNTFYLIFLVLFGKINKNSIFHVHGVANISPLFAGRLLGIPCLWLIHDTTSQLSIFAKIGLFIQWNKCEIATVSQRSLVSYALDSDKTHYLPAFVDFSFWNNNDLIPDYVNKSQNSAKQIRLLVVANLNPLKGIDVLLNALNKLNFSVHLKIVGSELTTHKEYANTIRRLICHLSESTDSQVELLGWKTSKEVKELLLNTDLFILPSLSEACPISLLEAMALKRRCIATNVGDVALITENNHCVQIVEPNNVEQLYQALCDTHKDWLNRDFSCNNALSDTWSISKVADKTYAVYYQLFT